MKNAGITGYEGMTSGPDGGARWWGDGHHRGLHGDVIPDQYKEDAVDHYRRLQALISPGGKGDKLRKNQKVRETLLNGRDDFWIDKQRDTIDALTPELVPEIRKAHDQWLEKINAMIFGDGDDAIAKQVNGEAINLRMELLAKIVEEVPEDLAQLITDAGGDPADFTFRGTDLFHGADRIPIFQDWITQ